MKKSEGMRGDKFRRFLFAVWLANKFEKTISMVNLSKIAGYDSPSGAYGIEVSGWVERDTKLGVTLTEKGKNYFKYNILHIHESIRQLLLSFLVFISLMTIQRYMYDNFGVILMGNFWFLVISALLIVIVHVFWYRLLWIISKNRAGK